MVKGGGVLALKVKAVAHQKPGRGGIGGVQPGQVGQALGQKVILLVEGLLGFLELAIRQGPAAVFEGKGVGEEEKERGREQKNKALGHG